MTKSLREYVKTNFIVSSYMKTIMKKNSPVIDMYIDVGNSLGYGEKKLKTYDYYSTKSKEICGLYFYPININDGIKEMAYLTYVDKNDLPEDKNVGYGMSMYVDMEGKLWVVNYTTHKGFNTDENMIKDTTKLKMYNDFLEYLEKNKKTSDKEDDSIDYLFIGDVLDKRFFRGSDENFYISEKNAPKIRLEANTEDFLTCKGIWTNLEESAKLSSVVA